MKTNLRLAVVAAAAIVALGATGCATKKHVRSVVAPVENRVGEVEKKTTEHTASIGQLEAGVSQADEKAMGADRKATQANEEALKAQQQAGAAAQSASGAREVAERGLTKTDELGRSVERTFANLDNYKMVLDDKVLFAFNRSDLSDEAKATLDAAAQKMGEMKSFVIEIQGYTDKSGGSDYNVELSRKRAQSVVRYLTAQHQIPLRRIHVLGVGEDTPAADNSTRAGRKENRRVEIRVFMQDLQNPQQKQQPLQTKAAPPAE